jgi:hypothetical protein
VLAGSSSLEMFGQGSAARRTSSLKSQAQYQAEAGDFDAAIREFGQLSNFRAAAEADLARFNQSVEAAAAKLDHHYSWMVAQCIADTNLAAWVRRTMRDEAAVKGFIADVNRNPKVIDGIPGVESLRTKLTALSGQKRGLVLQVAAKAWQAAGTRDSSAKLASMKASAAEQFEHAQNAAVTAMIIGLATSTPSVQSAAASYRGTGADASQAAMRRATMDYNTCKEAARRLPPAQQKKAHALCQAEMLETKAAWIG